MNRATPDVNCHLPLNVAVIYAPRNEFRETHFLRILKLLLYGIYLSFRVYLNLCLMTERKTEDLSVLNVPRQKIFAIVHLPEIFVCEFLSFKKNLSRINRDYKEHSARCTQKAEKSLLI